ncbi:MAG: DoxX family protein [Chitinophagaceae bacterium]|nr:DoxX family protein [Chitinophagaceae bacterium]
MQNFIKIIRWSVGLLFIFSGLIKANDPLGLSYKMQEFFEVWGMIYFNDYTLALSLIMNTLEILAGVALLIKFPYKQTLWLLLGLIIFFTFLTGYALFSGKIKTCGCFGDCIPLTPQTSFIKDIILFICIVILLFTQKKVKAIMHPGVGVSILLITTFLVGYGQKQALTHLPLIDCLSYKQGNDINEKMKIPDGAVSDSVTIMMEFEKEGKKYFFDANNFPTDFDSTYVYIDRKELVVSKGNGLKAGIGDFTLTTLSGLDTTQKIFKTPIPYVLVFAGYVDSSIPWNEMIVKLREKYKLIYIVTADKAGAIQSLPGLNVLIGDITMIKTAARVWPTIFVMNGSTIMQKITYQDYIAK